MPRSVNVVASRERRKKILKQTKGNFLSRKNVLTVAKNTWEKGLSYAYTHRRNKKRDFRSLWIIRINAGARQHGMSYSEFMGKLNAKGIAVNRKALADLAMNDPAAFEAIVNSVK
ncbi:MAG: 50S ribosomal protein L20 [Bacteroidales bacterium]|nr:50S ribosomal protein L20 [Bacteroidales bacterium]